MNRKNRKLRAVVFLIILSVILQCMTVCATEEEETPATGPDQAIDMSAAPAVVAESAVLMDVDTGVILFE